MNKKIKIEIAIGIVLVVAIIIGGIFWLQNKKQIPNSITPVAKNPITQPITQPEPSNENVNWQTYSNTISAFSVSVPKDWTFQEQLPTPFVATEFFGANDKSKRLLLVDRFETNEQANNEVKKDFIAWANINFINMNWERGADCKDGVVKVTSTTKGNYPAVIIDCPKRDTESFMIFTRDRHYLIEVPLSYKNSNSDLYSKIYSTFEVN